MADHRARDSVNKHVVADTDLHHIQATETFPATLHLNCA